MNSEFSLIYPTPESKAMAFAGANTANISDDTCEQLGLSYLLELKNSSLSEYFTTDAEVMRYRTEGFYDLLDNPELKDALLSVIPILNDIVELRQLDADMSGTTESYLYSITEIELYISCVEKLNEGLAPIREKLKSRSFKAMAERIQTLCESDYYKELNRKLTELTDRVREIKSITVGVNLDSQLRPSSAGVLSINSEQFKSGELLEKILRMNFKNDEYTCIAALVPFGRGQSENTKTALSYAFYSAINDVFKSSVKSWKLIVQSYVLDNTDFLISDRYGCLLVKVFVAKLMSKVVPHQFLDSVLEHITDYQHYKQRPGDVAVFDLRKPGHTGSEDHRNSRRNAVQELFHCRSVLLLSKIDIKVALYEFLEHSTVMHKASVMIDLPVKNAISLLLFVLSLIHDHLRKSLSDSLFLGRLCS